MYQLTLPVGSVDTFGVFLLECIHTLFLSPIALKIGKSHAEVSYNQQCDSARLKYTQKCQHFEFSKKRIN